jgi:hypothetical protein
MIPSAPSVTSCYSASCRAKRRPALLASNFKRRRTRAKDPAGGPRDSPAGLIETMAEAGEAVTVFPAPSLNAIGSIDLQCLKKRNPSVRTLRTSGHAKDDIWQYCKGVRG